MKVAHAAVASVFQGKSIMFDLADVEKGDQVLASRSLYLSCPLSLWLSLSSLSTSLSPSLSLSLSLSLFLSLSSVTLVA